MYHTDGQGRDLEAHTLQTLSQIAQDLGQDPQALAAAQRVIIEKSYGRVEWVDVVVASLRGQRSWQDVLQNLESTPSGLGDLYDHRLRSMAQLPEKEARSVYLLFIWLLNSRRPLSREEIMEAVHVKLAHNGLDKLPRLSESKLSESCQGLIRFDQNECKFIHQTFADFLIDISNLARPSIQFKGSSADSDIGHICAHYLMSYPFTWGPLRSSMQAERVLGRQPLALYAMTYWAEHLKNDEEQLCAWALELAGDKEIRETCIQLSLREWEMEEVFPFPGETTPLHFLSLYGLFKAAALVEDLESKLNLKDGFGYIPLDYALFAESQTMCLWLMEKSSKNAIPVDGYLSVLHNAARLDWDDVAQAAIQRGDDLERRVEDVTPLFCATEFGSFKVLDVLLEAGAKVNTAMEDGTTPLISAVESENLEITEKLLQAGGDVTASDETGCAALHYAARLNNFDIGSALLRSGADLSIRTKDSVLWAPLHLAAMNNSVSFIELLITSGADINVTNASKGTPLHSAASSGAFEAAEYLVMHGAYVNAVDDWGQTPLYIATRNNEGRLAKYLLLQAGVESNVLTNDQQTPLHQAAKQGSLDLVQILLHKNAQVDIRDDPRGHTPLIEAIKSRNLEVAKCLLENGANPNNVGVLASLPLHYAAFDGFSEFVEPMVIHGADFTSANADGYTPLLFAAMKGNVTFIKELVEVVSKLNLEFDINQSDSSGKTALHYFAKIGSLDTCKFLISHGVQMVADNSGNYPIHLAASQGQKDIVEELLTSDNISIQGFSGGTVLYFAAQNGHEELVKYLIQKKSPLDQTDVGGAGALLAALLNRHARVASLLLAAGARSDIADAKGYTTLHAAARLGDYDLVLKLIECGRSAMETSSYGLTPFQEAVASDAIDVVKLFLLHGQNGSATTCLDERTCFRLACSNGNAEMLGLILDNDGGGEFPNTLGEDGLYHAAAAGNYFLARGLIHAGCDLNGSAESTSTPLAAAAAGGYFLACAELCKLQACPHLRSSLTLMSPLHFSTMLRRPRCTKVLAAAGADPYERDGYGMTAVDYCLRHKRTMKSLRRAVPDLKIVATPDPLRCESLKFTIRKCLRSLIHQRPDITVRGFAERRAHLSTLGNCLMRLNQTGTTEAAKIILSELMFPPKSTLFFQDLPCNICATSLHQRNTYICPDCMDVTLCYSCHNRYLREEPPKTVPKGFEVIQNLERSTSSVEVSLISISHDPSLLVKAFSVLPCLSIWLDESLESYANWEKMYNSHEEYKSLRRPGQEFIKAVENCRSVLDLPSDGSFGVENQQVDGETKQKLLDLRKARQKGQDFQDFICSGHDYIKLTELDKKYVDENGQILNSYLEELQVEFGDDSNDDPAVHVQYEASVTTQSTQASETRRATVDRDHLIGSHGHDLCRSTVRAPYSDNAAFDDNYYQYSLLPFDKEFICALRKAADYLSPQPKYPPYQELSRSDREQKLDQISFQEPEDRKDQGKEQPPRRQGVSTEQSSGDSASGPTGVQDSKPEIKVVEDVGKPQGPHVPPEEHVAYPYQQLQWRSPEDSDIRLVEDSPIRILIVKHSVDDNAPIECQLLVSHKIQSTEYDTLSYTWGDPHDRLPIFIENHEVQVTRNLHAALKVFRRKEGIRRLWIDALCINQSDLAEKSIIIPNMHFVYYYAKRTIVWLGDRSEDSDLATTIITTIGEDTTSSASVDELALLQTALNKSVLDENRLELSKSHWRALVSIFSRPYWSRVWIVQEIVYSFRGIVVFCGEESISFDFICVTVQTLAGMIKEIPRKLGIDLSPIISTSNKIKVKVALFNEIQETMARNRKMMSALSLMRQFEATEPKDKVFGCLTLARPPPGIDVGYEDDCAEIFSAIARSVMELENSLRILVGCEGFEDEADPADQPHSMESNGNKQRHKILGNPTWSPNWAVDPAASRFPGEHDEDYILTAKNPDDTQLVNIPYQACGFSTPVFTFLDNGSTLVVKGILLDHVSDCSIEFVDKEWEIAREIHALILRSSNANKRYGSPLVDAAARLFTGNRRHGKKMTVEDVTFIQNTGGDPVFHQSLFWMAHRRRFFTTSAGYMGFGPHGLRLTDCICIIKGCYIPMVLRKIQKSHETPRKNRETSCNIDMGSYHVIGPAYVQGVMEGEVSDILDRNDLYDIHLR